MKERDDKFWEAVIKYEKLCTLRRELAGEIEEVKSLLFKGLWNKEQPDREITRYYGNKRIRVKATNGTTFSITALREKFGDEWVNEHSQKTSSGTIEVKYMTKMGPPKTQY